MADLPADKAADLLAGGVAYHRDHHQQKLAELSRIEAATKQLLDAIKARRPALLCGIVAIHYDSDVPCMDIIWRDQEARLIVDEHSARTSSNTFFSITDVDGICADLEELLA